MLYLSDITSVTRTREIDAQSEEASFPVLLLGDLVVYLTNGGGVKGRAWLRTSRKISIRP